MRFEFKTEDFESLNDRDSSIGMYDAAQIARRANAILDGYIATLPEVNGDHRDGAWFECEEDGHTHHARLWGIEESNPKECEHDPVCLQVLASLPPVPVYSCSKCKIKLKATWTEA